MIVVGVDEWPSWLRIVIATALGPPICCGVVAHRHGVREVELVDLPVSGRPARLVWRNQRWCCPTCRRAWTGQDPQIASARCGLTTRAARWATVQIGRHGRTVSEVAADLGCDWHTVMDAVAAYSQPLIGDPHRFGAVSAVGPDDDAVRPCRCVPSPAVVDPDRRRRRRAAARCCAWSRQRRAVPLVRRSARAVAGMMVSWSSSRRSMTRRDEIIRPSLSDLVLGAWRSLSAGFQLTTDSR